MTNNKFELFEECRKNANKDFLINVASSIDFPLEEKNMIEFNNLYQKMNPEEKYEIFKSFFEKELSYFSSSLDMGWLGFFVNDLNLSTGSNGVKNGGEMFFYDIVNACDFNSEMMKMLVSYFDLNEDCQHSLLSSIRDRYDAGDKYIEILKIMKSDDMCYLDIFPVVAYQQISYLGNNKHIDSNAMNHELLEGLDLNSTQFQSLMMEELSAQLNQWRSYLNERFKPEYLDGTELKGVNETVNNFLTYIKKYDIDMKELLKGNNSLFTFFTVLYSLDLFNIFNEKALNKYNHYGMEEESNGWAKEVLDLFKEKKIIEVYENNYTKEFTKILKLENKEENLMEIGKTYMNIYHSNESEEEKLAKYDMLRITLELTIDICKKNDVKKMKNKV